MSRPVEEKPFVGKVSAEVDQKGGGGWRLYDSANQQVAVILADADRVEEIVRLINVSFEKRVAEHFDPAQPLTMEFEAGELVKVYGARPEYMDGNSLIRLVKRLAKLNLAQEQEIGRYKAEVDGLNAEADRAHSRRMDGEALDRRDLFACHAVTFLYPYVSDLNSGNDLSADKLAKIASEMAFQIAEAMEAERAKAVRS
jgi:hypothetical protein